MTHFFAKVLRVFENYGNPIGLLAQRAVRRRIVRVVDRKTGIRCDCTRGSDRMFGETFHSRDYDIPKLALAPGDVVIDIGANHGFFTCFAASLGATVYAFEPTREVFTLLQQNLRLNGLENRVVARPWAIGPQNGEIELICSDQLGGMRNTTMPTFAEKSELNITQRCQVPCRSMASIFEEFRIDRVRLCKIDCEGAELGILSSLAEGVVKRIDTIVLEYHSQTYHLNELLKVLLGWGTHHISFSGKHLLRAVSSSVLEEMAAGES